MSHIIDARLSCLDEGASAEFYQIIGNKKIGFKQFRNKKFAIYAWRKQKILSRYTLAPKIFSKICRLPILYHNDYLEKSGWGFITEKAKVLSESTMRKRLNEIQTLVDIIYEKTGLKFWDSHYYNLGYIDRNNKAKLVCIDTGSESFKKNSNAWGMNTPGPKCNECDRLHCKCSSYSYEECI